MFFIFIKKMKIIVTVVFISLYLEHFLKVDLLYDRDCGLHNTTWLYEINSCSVSLIIEYSDIE